jgi:hypothetical protein
MDTVLDLLTDIAVDLFVISEGQTLSDDDATILFRALNKVVDSANAERLMHFGILKKSYALTANKGQYTIGLTDPASADFSETRPNLFQTASIVLSGIIRHPLDIKTSVQWAAISEPGKIANLPKNFYCDYNWPVATLYFDPVPVCSMATALEAFVWNPLPQFGANTDPVNLPPAYAEWLEYATCLRAAPKFLKPPNDAVMQLFAAADARVKRFNAQQLAGMMGESTTGNIPQSPAPSVNPVAPVPPQQ